MSEITASILALTGVALVVAALLIYNHCLCVLTKYATACRCRECIYRHRQKVDGKYTYICEFSELAKNDNHFCGKGVSRTVYITKTGNYPEEL